MRPKKTPFPIKPEPPQTGVRGAVHADLEGAPPHRYRPTRLHNDTLSTPIECEFVLEDEFTRRAGHVVDISATGLAIQPPDAEATYPRGTKLSKLIISHRDKVLFEGVGDIVYQSGARVGIRTGGMIDLHPIEVHEALEGRGLLQRVASLQEQFQALQPEWRAVVGDLAASLQAVRTVLDEIEPDVLWTELSDPQYQIRFLRGIVDEWSTLHLAKLQQLHFLSRALSESQRELGREYAETLLSPLYLHGALYNRAATKPRGYAGDYLTMLLFNKDEPEGHTLFAKFVDLVSKQHSLSTTALTRQTSVTERVLERIARGATKLVSLASGPATELGAVLDRMPREGRTVEFILVDQDDEALAYSHDFLLKKALERGLDSSRVQIACIHFSVKQILKPKTDEERQILGTVLKGADFIYSVGLLDYLPDVVARRLISALYGLLGGGGQLFIGNLVEAEDSTWLMDFVLAWHLVWRTPRSMAALAKDLDPVPSLMRVNMDATEKCLFLEVHAQ